MIRLSHSMPLLFLFTTILIAGPKIEFESRTVNCGIAEEGKTDRVRGTFKLRNTGTEALRISSVRPGCGCTVVEFDSVVAPGKSAVIQSELDTKGRRSGLVSHSITVTSNAVNEPVVRLAIEATVQAHIDLSENYLALTNAHITTPQRLYLASRKTDLTVTDVAFKTGDNPGGSAGWRSKLPTPIKFSYAPTDSTRADGYKVFKLDLYHQKPDGMMYGEFVIKTNHPHKKEFTVRGQLTP